MVVSVYLRKFSEIEVYLNVPNAQQEKKVHRFRKDQSEIPFTEHYLSNGAEFHVADYYKVDGELKTDGMLIKVSDNGDGLVTFDIVLPDKPWNRMEFWALMFIDEYRADNVSTNSSTPSPWRTTPQRRQLPDARQTPAKSCECPIQRCGVTQQQQQQAAPAQPANSPIAHPAQKPANDLTVSDK